MRPALHSSSAPGTSVNGSFAFITVFSARYIPAVTSLAHKRLPSDAKNAALGGVLFCAVQTRSEFLLGTYFSFITWIRFQIPRPREALPGCTRILVAPGPLAQPGGTHILIGSQFKFFDNLLKRSDSGDYGAYRLRLAPIGITATFCHLIRYPLGEIESRHCLAAIEVLMLCSLGHAKALILRIFSPKINSKFAVLCLTHPICGHSPRSHSNHPQQPIGSSCTPSG